MTKTTLKQSDTRVKRKQKPPTLRVRKYGASEQLVDTEGISPTLQGLDHGNNTPLVEVNTISKKGQKK